MLLRLALATAALLLGAPAAWAACANPTGTGGDIIYNVDYSVVQVCNGTNWVALGGNGAAGSETDPQVGDISTSGKWCTTNGSAIQCTSDAPLSSVALDDLTDVDTSGVATGNVIAYNGSSWVVSSSVSLLNDLTDATITTATSGDLLYYNGSAWVNQASSGLFSADRITSSTTAAIIANAGTGYISLTANASTAAWGYLGSSATYLPNLSTNRISTTAGGILSGTYVNGQYISATTITLGGTTLGTTLNSLTDVNSAGLTTGLGLQWNGTQWVSATAADLLSGTQVVFSTYRSTNQTITASTWTTIDFDTETIDTSAAFDTTTDRFTPQVAGYYYFVGHLLTDATTHCQARVLRNGSSAVIQGGDYGNGSGSQCIASGIAYMNGSTDYVQLQGYTNGGTTVYGNQLYTNFSGVLINGMGEAGGGGGATDLGGLTDTTLSSPVSGDLLYYNGSAWVNQASSGLFSADRITSSTTAAIIANSGTGYISLTANASTAAWGYLGASATYLPNLTSNLISTTATGKISATSISVTYLTVNGAQVPSAIALDDLTDVVTGSPNLGEVVYYNGAQWVNQAASSLFSADRITSGTTAVTANGTGYISLTTGGVVTGYLNPSGRLIVPGISATTNNSSFTTVYASGNVTVGGDINYTGLLTDTSDRRLKTDIRSLEGDALASIRKLNPVSFRMLGRADTELGFIAQDVEEVFPSLVKTAPDVSATKSLNYQGLIAPMVKAVQQLADENARLREENTAIRAEIDAIKRTLNAPRVE